MPQIGQTIEDFTLNIFQKETFSTVKLSDYAKRNKWLVLFFYPADFTFVCPTELEELADKYSQFKKLETEILSISTDTKYVHKAWHDESKAIAKVKYPMGADPTGKISRYFGVYLDDEGLALRGTFIIDPDGILKAYELHDNSIGRSSKELLRKLQAAKFVREHGGEVCPVNWEPGKETLKPGLDLVGKI